MEHVTVFSGAQRQRRWSEAEKRSMVGAAFAEDAIVLVVARCLDVSASQLYRWRGLYAARDREDRCNFAPVVVGEDAPLPSAPCVALGSRAPMTSRAEPVMVVESGGARLEIVASSPPKLVAAVLAALKRCWRR
jgi:transposase